MSDLARVIVLAGGLSPEREVSLRSGARVAEALRRTGVEAELRDIDGDLLPALAADPPDAAFPVLHGAPGEDGMAREVLELAGVPYVGARPDACRSTFDKSVAKDLLGRAGLPTPKSVTLPREAFHDLGAAALVDRVTAVLGLPLFVKPRAGGSAFGVTRVEDAARLPEALMACFAYHDQALIERCVAGTEIAVAVADLGDGAGPRALPAVEIAPVGEGIYDYTARYTAGAVDFYAPARISAEAAEEAARIAVEAHVALGLRDLSRTDLIVDQEGRPQVLETNVAPGMVETSTYPIALAAAGIDFGEFCRTLCEVAVQR
ncbi:D-alanine--D-alanine ligase [Mangrovactinospora gilvigrisea]|uniref:D-alanine--D-alanine ligase n=1 Tax=Mangrovactinospora gilvigrisea TaxID=1428644 RepID=A0A1J7C1Z9_9ACTN|nr:D-alanine--D-alanine ligase [Mangrovactinospora gilvigrisea]OIV35612.1 D-alanine--D-alanine ligase [Mangrovactinospora gilvigrisea]